MLRAPPRLTAYGRLLYIRPKPHPAATRLQATFRCAQTLRRIRLERKRRKCAVQIALWVQAHYRVRVCRIAYRRALDFLEWERVIRLRSLALALRIQSVRGSSHLTPLVQGCWVGKSGREILTCELALAELAA